MELAVCLSGEVHTHTSVLALLRGLRLLCQAGVQPRGRLGIVAVESTKWEPVNINNKDLCREEEKTTAAAEAQVANKKG